MFVPKLSTTTTPQLPTGEKSAPPPQEEAAAVPVDYSSLQGVCPMGFGRREEAPVKEEAPLTPATVAAVTTAALDPQLGGMAAAMMIEPACSHHTPPQPVTTWQDPAPTPAAKQREFTDEITRIQNSIHAAGLTPTVDRGFHQKQNWGGKATITFDKNMPAALQKEVFAQAAGQRFTAAVRFSNGQGCPQKDSKGDVRGVAVKMNIGGQEVDWLATNHITFARTPDQFMKVADVLATRQTDGSLAALHELVSKVHDGEYGARESARIAARIIHDAARPVRHIAAETYWTQAVKVGDMVGRFVFTPQSGVESKRGFFPEHDYLRDGMEHDLEKHDVKMRISFEAFTDHEVETDASVHGEHVTYPVGEMVFEQRAKDSAARAQEESVVSRMAFNPSHGMRMAGTLNESNRAVIYEQSANNRGAIGWDAPEVKGFFGRT